MSPFSFCRSCHKNQFPDRGARDKIWHSSFHHRVSCISVKMGKKEKGAADDSNDDLPLAIQIFLWRQTRWAQTTIRDTDAYFTQKLLGV